MRSTNEPLIKAEPSLFRIGVVVVAYASGDGLSDCISSLLADSSVTAVVVVDNSSDVESRLLLERATAEDTRLCYVDPHANLGFAKGCNAGVMELEDCTHVFFVNPDVKVAQPLSPLIECLEASTQAIVAGRLVSPRHPLSINARPLVSLRLELAKALFGTRAYRGEFAKVEGSPSGAPFVVGQVDGALLGMSIDTYSMLRGFDPQFELYFEDVDICARARPLGGCLFVPAVWGVHVGGASSSTVSETAYCVGAISRVRYIRKHFGQTPRTTITILSIAFIEFLARTLTGQAEGRRARARSLRLQIREVRGPGSVVLLRA